MDHRPTTALRVGAATILALGLLAGCAASPTTTTPTPATAATPAATPSPSTTPSVSVIEPSAAPSAGGSSHIVLTHATGDLVSVDIADASGQLRRATSGAPGDGASVEPYTLIVTNDTPSTLRLTWVGGPCDSANMLMIDETGRQFLLVQPECSGDSIAFDRILILEFAAPIVAAEVQAVLQDGLDTSG